MSTPHKCPCCDGSGKVSRPPGVAGDQVSWVSGSVGPWDCQACSGQGIVWGPLAPVVYVPSCWSPYAYQPGLTVGGEHGLTFTPYDPDSDAPTSCIGASTTITVGPGLPDNGSWTNTGDPS